MPKQPKVQNVPERETGGWSGVQDKKHRPGNENDKQGGQREYTEPSPEDLDSSNKAG